MSFALQFVLTAIAALFCRGDAQPNEDCRPSSNQALSLNTMMTSINLSCQVDASAVSSTDFAWRWLKLAPDTTIERYIDQEITSDQNSSVHMLQVECESSGMYQARYLTNNGSSCSYVCSFSIEVQETRVENLEQGFSIYPVIVNGTVPSTPDDGLTTYATVGSVQSLGVCGNEFYLPSTCVVEVSPTWYRDGSRLDTSSGYMHIASGELRIQNLSQANVGYYVCIHYVNTLRTTYQTHDTNIVLASPTIAPPTTMITQPTMTTTEVIDEPDMPFGRLETWEFGLIIGILTLLIIAALLGGAVWMARMTVRGRKTNKRQQRQKVPSSSSSSFLQGSGRQRRPRTMMEEIQMMGTESIDFDGVGAAGPVEIPFSCILFEELLHKGTFKVVHHGVVSHPMMGILDTAVAVKRLKDEKSELGHEELMNEAIMLRTFQEKAESHPNIVSMLGLTTQGGPTCLLLEFVANGTLEDFLVALMEGPVPDWYVQFVQDTLRGAYHKHVSGDLMNVIVQVAEGMKFLTDEGFVHRDLSVRNILMGERLNIKIANPGMHHEGYYYIVTERKHFFQDMAPECLWENRYSVHSDVWSFGILVYRTVTLNTTPFPDMQVDQLHSRMVGGERPQLLSSFSNEMYFLLQRCWQFVATERPTFATINNDLSHMSEKPTRHILLKATKDHSKPGHVSENGQVFLRALPPHTLVGGGTETAAKKAQAQRNSGTMRSLISSIDDTVYTRETAETVLDLTQSENENDNCANGNNNGCEQFLLKGDPVVVSRHDTSRLRPPERRSYDETDTSGNDGGGTAREQQQRLKPASRKSSKSHKESGRGGGGGGGGEGSAVSAGGRGSGTSSVKKKRRASGKTAAHKTSGFANKAFSVDADQDFMDGLATAAAADAADGGGALNDSGEMSSEGAPPTTDDDDKRATSELSGSEGGSQDELVRL